MQLSIVGQMRRNLRRPPPLAASGSSEFEIFESKIDIQPKVFSVSERHRRGQLEMQNKSLKRTHEAPAGNVDRLVCAA